MICDFYTQLTIKHMSETSVQQQKVVDIAVAVSIAADRTPASPRILRHEQQIHRTSRTLQTQTATDELLAAEA